MKSLTVVLVLALAVLIANPAVSQQVIELKPPSEETLAGVIKTIDAKGNLVVSVQTAPDTSQDVSIILNNEITITLDGKVAKASDLRPGHTVTVRCTVENTVAIVNNVPTREVLLRTAQAVFAVSATPQTASPEKAEVVRTSEWEFTLISAKKVNVLKKQELKGAQFDGTMYRGGHLVSSDVRPTNGVFLIVEIRAELLSKKGKPKEKSGNPWKDAARALREYGNRQPLVCDSSTSYVQDTSEKQYPTLGSLREEGGTYYLQVVGVQIMGPMTFNLYFDIPKTAQSLKMRISTGVPLIDVEL